MAWRLHYTSVRSGPTGRSGFQYVAATPGVPPSWESAAAPYLVYRPPPDVPADSADGFPEAFGYDLVDGHALLVHCHYTGRDYSGRHGNFLGQAIVADPAELEGLRPIELWRSALWTQDAEEPLDDLFPGDAFTPESLGAWLAGRDAYPLLATLLDAVVDLLCRGHGRIVVVGADTAEIARWIAVVSYSLPIAATAGLSFLTYSADPEAAPYGLVGTTPGVWEATAGTGTAFLLDRPRPPRGLREGRFGRIAAACWRDLDFDGLDSIGEFAVAYAETAAAPIAEGLDTAAALHSLRDLTAPAARGTAARDATRTLDWAGQAPRLDTSARVGTESARTPAAEAGGGFLEGLRLAEISAAVRLGVQVGAANPAWDAKVRAAVAECVRRGEGEVAAALRTPGGGRVMAEGVLLGLEGADDPVREAALGDEVCDLLFEFLRDEAAREPGFDRRDLLREPGADRRAEPDWPRNRPQTSLLVLTSIGRREPGLRFAVTALLLDLAAMGLAAAAEVALHQVWGERPAKQDRRRPGVWAREWVGILRDTVDPDRRGEAEG